MKNYVQPEDYWPANDYGLEFIQVNTGRVLFTTKYRNDGWMMNDWIFSKQFQTGVYSWSVKLVVI